MNWGAGDAGRYALSFVRGMKFIDLIAVFALLLNSFAVAASEPFPQARRSSEPGKLVGMVVDPNEARIAGARIIIEGSGNRREVMADEEGFFVANLPEGRYRITAQSYGFRTVTQTRVYVRANHVRAINFKLFPASMDGEHRYF